MTYNYLLFDPFRGHRQESLSVQDFNFGYRVSITDDMIDLKENDHIIGPTFTIEMWIWNSVGLRRSYSSSLSYQIII